MIASLLAVRLFKKLFLPLFLLFFVQSSVYILVNYFPFKSTTTNDGDRQKANKNEWASTNVNGQLFSHLLYKILTYVTHDPIKINGNTEFANKAALENWSGNGSLSNPFIIENYQITNSTNNVHGIDIRSTSYYFILRNNYITVNGTASSGIYLHSIYDNTALIENNILQNNSKAGIEVLYSNGVTIKNNTLINNSNYGISIFSSNYFLIDSNTVTGHINASNSNFGGFYITGSVKHGFIRNNTLSANYNGLRMFSFAENNTIEYNYFSLHTYFSIYFGSLATNNTIATNIFTKNNNQAIWIENAEYNLIANNVFNSNYATPLWLSSYGNYNIVSNNTVIDNIGAGIWLNSYADHNIVSNNNIKNNSNEGIRLSSTVTNATVINNYLLNNGYGIDAFISASYIAYNYIQGSNSDSIRITWSDNSIVEHNILTTGKANGFYLYDSTNVTITNNTIIGSTNYGIYISSTTVNKIYLNNFLHNKGGSTQGYVTNTLQLWNNGTHGNFWLDYTGTDNDSNGIGDSAYILAGGLNRNDSYPLMV
jgi:parallel beta-helix repeat protein